MEMVSLVYIDISWILLITKVGSMLKRKKEDIGHPGVVFPKVISTKITLMSEQSHIPIENPLIMVRPEIECF
jgi:hypothetical protein